MGGAIAKGGRGSGEVLGGAWRGKGVLEELELKEEVGAMMETRTVGWW